MHKLSILFLLILFSFFAEGSTIIQCDNVKYAGVKLDFFQYSNPITKEAEFVFSLEFDKTGKALST